MRDPTSHATYVDIETAREEISMNLVRVRYICHQVLLVLRGSLGLRFSGRGGFDRIRRSRLH